MKIRLSIFLLFCTLMAKGQGPFEEFVHSEHVKSLTLYAYSGTEKSETRYLIPPVAQLENTAQQIVLEFDDLRAQYVQYKVRIIHCDMDWSRSRLLDMEFMKDINETFVEDYHLSRNTKIPYYHYRLVVPKPILSGNYILQLYDESEVVAQRRFWIYENQVHAEAKVVESNDPNLWKTHQQLDLRIDLGNYRVGIPKRELFVLIRVNQDQWKKVNNDHLASSGRNSFSLQQFSNDYLFPGQNEYRFLDISNTFSRGMNVDEIIRGRPDVIITTVQQSRAHSNYVQSYDNDGGFLIRNIDNGDPDYTSDYVEVLFRLSPVHVKEGQVPVLLSRILPETPLEWNEESGYYELNTFLKNGFYDYAFGLRDTKGLDRNALEGDFQQTRNTYEVFIYHAVPGKRNVSLVGYQLRK
jgi:hypothetical protein